MVCAGVLEDSMGRCTNPLYRRLDNYLHEARPKLSQLQTLCADAATAIGELMSKYGEDLKALSEIDTSQKFFSTIAGFARSFSSACDENIKKRQAVERAARIEAGNALRKKSNLSNNADRKLASAAKAGLSIGKPVTADTTTKGTGGSHDRVPSPRPPTPGGGISSPHIHHAQPHAPPKRKYIRSAHSHHAPPSAAANNVFDKLYSSQQR